MPQASQGPGGFRPAPIGDVPFPYPVAGGTQNLTVASTPGALLGFNARETVGGYALFRLHDGTASTGQWLAFASLSPSQSCSDWYGPQGIGVASGIWLERVSGQVELTVYEG